MMYGILPCIATMDTVGGLCFAAVHPLLLLLLLLQVQWREDQRH
jgi:hypothetical protein